MATVTFEESQCGRGGLIECIDLDRALAFHAAKPYFKSFDEVLSAAGKLYDLTYPHSRSPYIDPASKQEASGHIKPRSTKNRSSNSARSRKAD